MTTRSFPASAPVSVSRRKFVALAGIGTVGVLGASQIPVSAQAPTDVDILNFALNLEYLEAEFYLRAVYGRGLREGDITGTGTLGPVIGGRRVPFTTAAIQQYGAEIARDEEAHVKFLRAAITSLGGQPAARPTIDLQQSFNAAAAAAGLGSSFDPFANENNFLLGAFIFEDVGVTAYKGAAPLIMNLDVLEAAAGILAVEGYHAGEIRTVLFARGFGPQTVQISDARDALDGPGDRDQGVVLDGEANIVPADENSLVFSRTPQQVLDIVYLGGAVNNFGFFPDRMNGTIR